MRSLNQLARALTGRTRLEEAAELQSAATYTLTGTATSDSSDGSVRVVLTDDVTRAAWDDDDTSVELPTNGYVRKGQRVYVTCFGGSMQEMVVSGVVGEGDELRADVDSAASAAATAWEYADSANDAAVNAWDHADSASKAATSAQVQLAMVEDVAGTLEWIRDHGTYVPTTDTSVQEGTVYFELVGGDYVPVAQPAGDPSAQGWYVLDVTESQSDYIMAHLAVTSAGLWVLPSGLGQSSTPQGAPGYKALLASDGLTIYDARGHAVATFGESVTFSSDRPQYIGGEDAYIVFHDADEDGEPDTITIGGHVVMGTGESLSELLAGVSYDHTFSEGETTYDFRAYAYRGGVDVTDEFDPDCFGWWLRTEDGDEWLGSGVTMGVLKSRAGYRASVVGGLTVTVSATLVDSNGNEIVDGEGDAIRVLAVG